MAVIKNGKTIGSTRTAPNKTSGYKSKYANKNVSSSGSSSSSSSSGASSLATSNTGSSRGSNAAIIKILQNAISKSGDPTGSRAAKIAQLQGGGTTSTTTTTTPSTTETTAPVTQDSLLSTYEDQQKSYIDQMAEAQSQMGDVQQSAYEKIFGPGSTIADFYNPSLQATQQAISSVTEHLRKLPGDIVTENQDVGITDAQQRRIEAKRTGELADTLAGLTSSYDILTAGLSQAMTMGSMQYDAMVGDAQSQIDATMAELSAKSALNDQQLAEVKQKLQDKLDASVSAKKQVDSILQDAQNAIYSAGITPSQNFQKVIKDAYQMADEGSSLADIQYAVFNAISMNPSVKSYLTSTGAFAKKSSSSGSSSKSSSSLDAQIANAWNKKKSSTTWQQRLVGAISK